MKMSLPPSTRYKRKNNIIVQKLCVFFPLISNKVNNIKLLSIYSNIYSILKMILI